MTTEEYLQSKGLRRTKNNIKVLNYFKENPFVSLAHAQKSLKLQYSSFYDVIRRFNENKIEYI